MEGDDYRCHSGSSSPVDPLAHLSDCAPGSLCSSWGSEESFSHSNVGISRDISRTTHGLEEYPLNWQQRCAYLQTELLRFQNQANYLKNTLDEKLSEMESRVANAESRAKEAEMKAQILEEKLQHTSFDWPSCIKMSSYEEPNQNSESAISKLTCEVEEQRQLRIQDAKFVEAKAARIKEWVTNKLRDLEAQNQYLREQNLKCNQQLEFLQRYMAQLTGKEPTDSDTPAIKSASPPPFVIDGTSVDFTQNLLEIEPVYAQVDHQRKKHASSNGKLFTHRRYLSAGTVSSISEPTSSEFRANNDSITPTNVDNHSSSTTIPAHTRSRSTCIADLDLTHDYAEIYTPNCEKLCWNNNNKPPTPPLHRFPSWESRIYQVADEGLSHLGASQSDQSFRIPHTISYTGSSYYDISCPVYATIRGRSSQVRSSPFSGDSSDESSDGEDLLLNNLVINSPITNNSKNSTDNSISSSSPSKSQSQRTNSSLSPTKCNSLGSPSKNASFDSCISDDYAIPPDAVSNTEDLSNLPIIANIAAIASPDHQKLPVNELCVEKEGNLAKLSGKLKTWRKRWFHLSSAGVIRYWKCQSDIHRKPRGEIFIDEPCTFTKLEGGTTFQISTPKKKYYLTADSVSETEEWIKILQNVQAKNTTKLLLSKNSHKPTLQGWLTKVRNGHTKKCWCVLVGKIFFYFKTSSDDKPIGQINMKGAKVEQVDHISDSDSDEELHEKFHKFTVGIFPPLQPPTYLLMSSKQEMDSWLYHLTIISSGNPNVGTQFEQLIQKLMETDGAPSNSLWKHPLLLYSKETVSPNLTSLPSETLILEASKLFKSCQLFMSVAVESAGIDYHVVLAQNALQLCLDNQQLQSELMCILVKQTSPHTSHKVGVQVLSKLRHRSLFSYDTAGTATVAPISNVTVSTTSNVDVCKSNPPNFVFLQGWQLLALAVSLFVPKDHKILWYLKCHIARNADTKTECGKYAAYCERALQHTIQNGNREMKPSRMEVLSIILKNPYHHSLPHSIPVHFLNGSYQVVSFNGSTTVQEFLKTLTQDIGCRDAVTSGFTLFSDDPIEKDLEHYIDPHTKLCDIISKWETALREKGLGKFENTRVIQLVYKNRLYFKNSVKNETDREKLLMCYQTNHQIVNGHFPLTKELALELAALMTQIDFGEFNGEKGRISGSSINLTGNSKDLIILQAVDKFYPYRYRVNLSSEALRELQISLQEKWISLKGRGSLDCIRIYLTCTRKWQFFGASLFQAKWKRSENMNSESMIVWLAVSEENISLLELESMQLITSYPYSQILTFGGSLEDFMLVINGDGGSKSYKLLFSMSKQKLLELTLIIADYMNALSRNGILSKMNIQPDILKATPDHQLNKLDVKKYYFDT